MELSVPLIRQEKFMWCWAASIEMILKYYEINDIGQEKIASKYAELENLPRIDNSLLERIDKLDQFKKEKFFIEGMELVNDLIEKLSSKNNQTTLLDKFEINNVIEALDRGQPVLAIVKTGGTAPHMVVVIGYEKNNDKIRLVINNPGIGLVNSNIEWHSEKITIEMTENGDFVSGDFVTRYSIHKYLIIHRISQRSAR